MRPISVPQFPRALAYALGLLGALAYLSWPLGYLLDPRVAGHALASYLELAGQPYSWLFVGLDCLAGATCVAAALGCWPRRGDRRALARCAAVAFALFGVMTAVNSITPLQCNVAVVATCGASLAKLNVDDVLTGIAMAGIFLALLLGLLASRRHHARVLLIVGTVSLLAWSAWGLDLLSSHFSGLAPVGIQHVVLSLTSLLILLTPALLVTARTN